MTKKLTNKFFIVFALIAVLGLIAGFALLYVRNNMYASRNTDTKFATEYPDTYEILLELLNHDTEYYDDDEINDWLENNTEEIETIKKTYPGYYNFAYGMVSVHNEEKADAIAYFNKTLSLYGMPYYEDISDTSSISSGRIRPASSYSNLTQWIAGRTYYELSRICIQSGYDSSVLGYYEHMNQVIDLDENLDSYVYLNQWAAEDAGALTNGAQKTIDMLEELVAVAVEYQYDGTGEIYESLADAYGNIGDSAQYINNELIALEYAQSENDQYSVAMCYSSIAMEYLDNYNFDKAEEYAKKAYDIVIDDENQENYMKTYECANLALIEIRQGKYTAGLSYLDEAEQYRQLESDDKEQQEDLANILSLKAEYEIGIDKPDEAIENLDSAYNIYKASNSFSYVNFDLELYILYGNAYLAKDDGTSALVYFRKAQSVIINSGIQADGRYLLGLYEAYTLMEKYSLAHQYSEQYIDFLNEQLYDTEADEAAYLLEEFQSEEKDSLISQLEKQKKFYGFAIAAIVVALVIFLSVGVNTILSARKIKKLNRELKELSERDGLTGLYNRRKLDDYLNAKWAEIVDSGEPVGVIMIDVDFFKKYNDRYGHIMGDNALIAVANVLKARAAAKLENTEDILAARYGGEEFVLVFPNHNKAQMEGVVEGIQEDIKSLEIPHEASAAADHLTLSIGCAIIDKNMSDLNVVSNYEAAISLADYALYEAKKNRNCACFKR